MSKILIIEDDVSLQKTLQEYLMAENFKVFCAYDGEEGLQKVNAEKPDIVLLDIVLPKINGYEVLRKIKKNPKTNKIPVILLTNLADMRDVEKALDLGATNYLVKSDYKMEEIVDKVRDILKKK